MFAPLEVTTFGVYVKKTSCCWYSWYSNVCSIELLTASNAGFFIVTAMLCLRCSVIYVQLENKEVPLIECMESNTTCMSNTFDIMLVEVGGDSLTHVTFLISEKYIMVWMSSNSNVMSLKLRKKETVKKQTKRCRVLHFLSWLPQYGNFASFPSCDKLDTGGENWRICTA